MTRATVYSAPVWPELDKGSGAVGSLGLIAAAVAAVANADSSIFSDGSNTHALSSRVADTMTTNRSGLLYAFLSQII